METLLKLEKFSKNMLKESKKNKNKEEAERWKRILELNKKNKQLIRG